MPQSRNLQCLAHYEQVSDAQLAGHIPTETAPEYHPSTGYANSINENMDSADEIDEGGQVLHFEGDFFCHYTEKDYEWPNNHGVAEGDKDADKSLDEEVVFDGEIGWEPAVLNAPDVGAPVSGPSEMSCEHIHKGYSQKIAGSENIYAPFESKLDFNIALWAKMCGTGSTAFTDLLAINDVHDHLRLSYKSSCELNNIIDKKLPTGRLKFCCQEVVVAREAFDVYFQDVVECVKALYEDPEFAPYLVFVPERHYANKDKTMQLYHDMHTGKWWWHTQKEIKKEKPGVTIILIILSSDKNQVTVFGNKTAYPKPSWHAHILLAYLPTTHLEHIKNWASQCHTITNLFHTCMGHILEPLKSAKEDGLHMHSSDGITRHGHPLLACYVDDYPKQILVSGMMTGECPKCNIPNSELGSKDALFKPQDLESILAALNIVDEDPIGFAERCAELRIKPIQHPFWQGLPKSNIFHLYQGLMKHMIAWIKLAFGEAEIDAHCFSGAEHNQICHFLLGDIIDIPLPNNISSAKLVRALSQYPCHSAETLQLLNEALTCFYDNKDIFVTLGIRTQFNLPKLHSYWHYLHMIQEYGMTDNYNTEYTERLHIDLTKDAYCATNHKDEYSQMTLWLERQEKILQHASYVHWCLAGDPLPQSHLLPDMQYAREYKMMKHPPVEHTAGHVYIPFTLLPIFHKVRYNAVDSADHKDENVTIDSQGNTMPGHFNTVLVNCGNGGEKSVEGYCVAQVWVIFSIPEKHHTSLFPSHILIPKHLAYVEWFSPFTRTSERNHGMHKVLQSYKNGEQLVSIISVKDI
ncbi:hypothetical protein BDR06DRAFT_985328 [Suillus hirtellus]|nr:hypothetical protein BDR06DRAFT_985328 [Suillus hirtellus]